MNKRALTLPGALSLLVFLLMGCAHTGSESFTKRSDKIQRITLRTRGEAGQHFTAKLNIDGLDREISGVSPAQFPLEVCVLTGKIRKDHGDGTLGFEIIEGGATLGFGALATSGDSCRFRYHDNGATVW